LEGGLSIEEVNMDMHSIIKDWKANAEKHSDRHFDFLHSLKMNLLPHSEPTLSHILGRPFFWGLISIGGGVCAIQHGFCRCISAVQRNAEKEH
jgi:hypothetical protein